MSWRPTSRRSVDSAGSSIGATAQKRHCRQKRHPVKRARMPHRLASSRSWRGSNPTQLVSLQSTRSATRCHARWRSLLSRLPAPSRTATGRAVFATARPTHKADRRPAAKLATKIYSKSRVPPRDSRIGGRSVAGGRTFGGIAVEIGVGRRTIAKWVKLDDVLDRQRCVLQSRSPLYFQGFLARR